MIASRFLRMKCYRILGYAVLTLVIISIIDISGICRHLQEKSYHTEFTYPLETPNFINLIKQIRNGKKVDIMPINNLYNSITLKSDSIEKCREELPLTLLILVKSAPSNRKNRNVIRETWKVSAIEHGGRVLFFIGNPHGKDAVVDANLQQSLDEETITHKDIVRLGFMDSYYNNTIKTVLEMRWAAEECPNFTHVLLVDDDYFVSIKNLLRFINNPMEYPTKGVLPDSPKIDENDGDKLYAGYRLFPPPHRHKIFTKWFMPLEEYSYDYYPPYITAGAVLLSKDSLLDLYYASSYTAHFRFDDIYVAICARKMNITPIHSEYFRFWTTRDESPEEYLIASHGFSDPNRLGRFWTVQKSHGFC